MKRQLQPLLTRMLCVVLPMTLMIWSCKSPSQVDTSTLGNWTQKSAFDGVSRSAATGFTIDNKAFLGTGTDRNKTPLHDFWRYDPITNDWTQRHDFPGVNRSGAVGFSLNGKGYIGLGIDAAGNRLRDFYEYNPATDAWRRVTDFSGSARMGAIAFTANGKGYVGFGDDLNASNDLWAYSPDTDTWQKRATYPNTGRVGAVAFVIDNFAYIGTGTFRGANLKDWWAYSPAKDEWIRKKDLPNGDYILRSNGVGFVIDGKGYLSQGSTLSDITWKYDPGTDSWTQKRNFLGQNRLNSFGFSLGTRGYITTGEMSGSVYDDLWNYDPNY